MSSRTMVMIIAGVIVLFTIISLRNHFTEEPPAPVEAVKQTRVLTAKKVISAGSFIKVADDLDWQPITEEASKEGLIVEGVARAEDFAGAISRRNLQAGEKIPADALMKSGEGGFMSAVLKSGMRAISISVTVTSGNAGFISPGDRVDLLLTHRMKTGGKESGQDDLVLTETFARNVRVLAVDQQLDNPENKAILAKTITVEVTPRQAEQINVAAEFGKISVSLVSMGTDGTLPVTDDTAAPQQPAQNEPVDLSVLNRKEQGISRVRVVRGKNVEVLEFYQDKQ